MIRLLLALALLLPASAFGQASRPVPGPAPGIVRVRLVTSAGAIVLALDARHAPKTAANFLAYVDDGRFEGTAFFRTARRKSAPTTGFVEGGIGTDARRMLDPLPLEPTSRTGLHHTDGAISMARYEATNSASGNFSIFVGPNLSMDARSGNPGYAVFGHVVAGMDVVKRILARPSGGGEGPTAGQMLLRPVTILRAERLDGAPHPTGRPKPWTLTIPR